ncbi:hypothetical protein NitYY0918_C0227 [Nitratiruptor sp. YY09-18]|nr:hypothetical protein NitYY0918_C0227 [Nitratiruptor sp. YY09-18]
MSAEVIEAQLHHQIGSSVTRAYMRSDFLERECICCNGGRSF